MFFIHLIEVLSARLLHWKFAFFLFVINMYNEGGISDSVNILDPINSYQTYWAPTDGFLIELYKH